MMKFMRKSKGFISIFLCLVLLPMVTFSTMVIDVSRLQNARALVTSAGDLAMNAGMSEYNKTLQEMYGIFATSTSDEALEKALANYFSKTIEGSIGTSNLSEKEYIQKYAAKISSWLVHTDNFDDEDFTNFLQMELESAEVFEYIGVDNSSPANPAVMKQQIVDYMKYKGPVSLSMNLLNKIGALKDSKKQVDAIEKKVDYTQTLDNLTDPCEKAFKAVYGSDTDYDSSEENKGYNDYVADYNKDYIGSGKPFEKGLKQNDSAAYNNIKENMEKMNVFLLYYTTANISAGVNGFDEHHNAVNYNMQDLGGLKYDKFKSYMIKNKTGYNKYGNQTNIDNCSDFFDELVAKNDISKIKKIKSDAQTITFTQTQFDQYFTQANAEIKTDVKKTSDYCPQDKKGTYLVKAEVNKDKTNLTGKDSNVSTKLLDEWKGIVSPELGSTYDSISEADGKTFDLILNTLDKEEKYKMIVDFIMYQNQIRDLSASFQTNWEAYDKKVKEKVETEKEKLKEQYKNDYKNSTEGLDAQRTITFLKEDVAKYEGSDGLIEQKKNTVKEKEQEYQKKLGEYNKKVNAYNNDPDVKKRKKILDEIENEKDKTKKAELTDKYSSELSELNNKLKSQDDDIEQAKKGKNQAYSQWQKENSDLTYLESYYAGQKAVLAEKEKAYNDELEKREKAAGEDAEILVKADNNYYEYLIKRDISKALAEQAEKLNKRLQDEILDKLSERVDEFYEHGKPYLKAAMDELDDFYVCVCECYNYAKKSEECLQTVLDRYTEVETAYNNWKTAADEVEDQTTKTTMLNDVNNTSSGLKKGDINKAKSIATQRKIYFGNVKQLLENITYFDDGYLIDKSQDKVNDAFVNTIYKKIAAHKDENGFGHLAKDDRNSTDIKDTKSKRMVEVHLHDSRNSNIKYKAFEWDPKNVSLATDSADKNGQKYEIHYGDMMEGSKNIDLTNKDDSYENEMFFKVLILIVKPEKNDNAEDKEKVEKIKEVKKEASEDKSSSGSGSGLSGKVKEEKTTVSDKISVKDDVLQAAQKSIDNYGNNGGKNEANTGDVGDERKNFEISDDQKKYKDNSGKAKESLTQANNLLNSLSKIGSNVLQDAYLEEYFTEMFTCQTDVLEKNVKNKMLNGVTIKDMYKTDTAWYGGEVEYIIWGGDSIVSAKVKNEVAIYALRFALNAIYAFTAADIQEFTLTAATAIAGWTVVGVPIVQVLLTIGLAAAESGVDLIKLKNGQDVPVYKNMQTFVCSPTGALKKGLETVATYTIEKGVSVAQKLVNDKIDAFNKFSTEKLEAHMAEVGELKDAYLEEQRDHITSTLENMIATPLVEKLKPIVMLKDAAGDAFKEEVSDALDDAFENINKTIASNEDGAIKELGGQVVSYAAGHVKAEILAEITSGSGISADQLSEYIREKIKTCVDSASGKIDEKLDEVGKKFMAEAEKCKDCTCNKVKELSEKWSTKAGESLTSRTTSFIDKKFDDSAIESLGISTKADSGSSGGLTLNYKEYCKIFVLIGLISDSNEAAMLQRCAALCQVNVQNANSKKFKADSSFEMVKANTVVSVHAKVKLGTLFPWGVTVSEDGATDSSSFGITNFGSNSVIIDYQGVNAY